MKRLIQSSLAAIFPVLLFLTCSNITVSGNGSQTTNAAIPGIIYEPDGHTPAVNAIVQFIPAENVPGPQLGKTQTAAYSTTTNSLGQYTADGIANGYYNIFGAKGDYLCYAESIQVQDSLPLPNDTLQTPGSLKGVVQLIPGHDSRNVLILIFGTSNFISPTDSIGNFSLADMAAGTYRVRFLTTGGGYNYHPLDTSFSIVSDSESVLNDTIRMQMDSLDMPVGVAAFPLATGLALTWKKTAGSIIYEIYRSDSGSNNFSIIGHTIDTFYYDESTGRGRYYFYRIQATNSMAVSPLSDPCSMLTTPDKPDSVKAIALPDSQIRISWNPVRSTDKYRIFIDAYSPATDDSTGFIRDTVDTLANIDYRSGNRYFVKAYNSSGESGFSSETTIPLGTILATNPYFICTGIDPAEPLTRLYKFSHIHIDTGSMIFIYANDKSTYLFVTTDSTEYIPGNTVYNYPQLLSEIDRFLKAEVDSHITVQKASNNGILITNPPSSGTELEGFRIYSTSSGQYTLFFDDYIRLPIDSSAATYGIVSKKFRPAKETDLIKDLYNYRGDSIFVLPGLEDGDIITIEGQIRDQSIDPVHLSFYSLMPLQAILDAIQDLFTLPDFDGTPESYPSVSVSSTEITINNNATLKSIPAGSFVIRGKPSLSFRIWLNRIEASDSDFDANSPINFNRMWGFSTIQEAGD